MVAIGRELLARDGATDARLTLALGDAAKTGLADNSVDLLSLCLVMHELPAHATDAILREASRVLRPGGRFLCLEFSRVANPILRLAYEKYSFGVIPKLGGIVAGDEDSYQYLVESIARFPTQVDARSHAALTSQSRDNHDAIMW